MKKLILICCIIAGITLSSCSNADTESISLNGNLTSQSQSDMNQSDAAESSDTSGSKQESIEVGVGINYKDGESNLYYDGSNVNAEIAIECGGTPIEIGLLVYVNGAVQGYTTDDDNTISAMHKYQLDSNQQAVLKVHFKPVTGKSRETLNVVFGAMLNPSFIAKDEYKQYGNNHAITTFGVQKLVMNANGEGTPDISNKYSSDDMTESFRNEYIQFNEDGTIYRNRLEQLNYVLSIDNNEQFLDKDGSMTYQLFGGSKQTYRVSLYINNTLVENAFDGKAYVDMETTDDKISSINLKASDISGLKDGDFIYLIAVPLGESERELYESINITYMPS